MKSFVLALAFSLIACSNSSETRKDGSAAPHSAAIATGPQVIPAAGAKIEGSYIVRLRETRSAALQPSRLEENATRDFARSHGIEPAHVYSIIRGFAAHLTLAQVAALRAHPEVAYIEEDQVFEADTTQYNPPSWGLDRIDQAYLPLDGAFNYNADGTGVNAYVIDTGIDTSHPDFGGRASFVYDGVDGTYQDCNGHGTHVAGTIGSASYGVAKNVNLFAVRVLDCQGSGSTSVIVAAMNWVATNAVRPAVANMSLGGGYSQSLNDAATNLASSGVSLSVAAGNSSADACNFSPASAPGTITVAASDVNDQHASFSNYGGCVDLYGPGVSITSTWLAGGTNTISGTSMATPHVTGTTALYKQVYGDQASNVVHDWIVNAATAGVIAGAPGGTPNRLLDTGGL